MLSSETVWSSWLGSCHWNGHKYSMDLKREALFCLFLHNSHVSPFQIQSWLLHQTLTTEGSDDPFSPHLKYWWTPELIIRVTRAERKGPCTFCICPMMAMGLRIKQPCSPSLSSPEVLEGKDDRGFCLFCFGGSLNFCALPLFSTSQTLSYSRPQILFREMPCRMSATGHRLRLFVNGRLWNQSFAPCSVFPQR